jgi:hypothetical protein
MLGAHKPLHLRQAEERRQKLLPDLVGEQTVAVLRDGRGVENLASSSAKAAFASRRIARSGCRAGMRASTPT